jgi:hypothetical protein
MDLDAFVAVHRPEWERLDALARRRRLSGAEADELVRLYQRAATHLSVVRSAAPDPALAGRLSTSVARARAAISGGHEPPWRELARLVTVSFPAAVWRARWWVAASATFTVVIALAAGIWVASSPSARAAVGSDAQIRRLVEVDFEEYYRQFPPSSFAARVWTNNAWIAAMCVVVGISGVGVVWLLFQNALNVGVVGGLMAAYGRLELLPPDPSARAAGAHRGLRRRGRGAEAVLGVGGPRARAPDAGAGGRGPVDDRSGARLIGVLAVSG